MGIKMKNFLIGLIITLLMLASCNGSGTNGGGSTVTNLRVLSYLKALPVGKKIQLGVGGAEVKWANVGSNPESIIWSSSNPNVISIDAKGLATAVSSGEATVVAKTESETATLQLTAFNDKLKTIQIIPTQNLLDSSLPVGIKFNFKAYGHYASGRVYDLTNQLDWSSSPNGYVNVDAGEVSTLKVGSVSLEAKESLSGVSSSIKLNIINDTLSAIFIKPQADLAVEAVSVGSQLNLKAFANYTSGRALDVTNSVIWQPNKDANIKIIQDIKNNVAAVIGLEASNESVPVTAKLGAITSPSYPLFVESSNDQNNLAIYISGVWPESKLSAQNSKLVYSLPSDLSTQYKAIAYSSSGYRLLSNSLKWSVTPQGSASINNNGVLVPNNLTNSIGLVRVTSSKLSADAKFIANSGKITSISIQDNVKGLAPKGVPVLYGLKLILANKSAVYITSVPEINWTSSNESVVYFTGVPGEFIAKKDGKADIVVTYTNPNDGSVITTKEPLQVKGALKSIGISTNNNQTDFIVNSNTTLMPFVTDTDGNDYLINIPNVIKWSVNNPVATIDTSTAGVVKFGDQVVHNIKITAKLINDDSLSNSIYLNTSAGSGNLAIASEYHVNVGQVLNASARTSQSNLLTAPEQVKWSIIGDKNIAQIDPFGYLLGLKPGKVQLEAEEINNKGKITLNIIRDFTVRPATYRKKNN